MLCEKGRYEITCPIYLMSKILTYYVFTGNQIFISIA
jgi:hypothetical protein